MLLEFHQDTCKDVVVSHRGTGQLLNRVATKTSAHQATVQEQLHACAVGVQKERSCLPH